jgi:Ras-related GTP-binding protein C/D
LSRPRDVDGISFDDNSYTCVKLNNELYLYLKQVNKFLAFVCVVRDEIFSENRGIMDYNLTLFKDSVKDVLFASTQTAAAASNKSSSLQDNSNLANSMLNNLSLNNAN